MTTGRINQVTILRCAPRKRCGTRALPCGWADSVGNTEASSAPPQQRLRECSAAPDDSRIPIAFPQPSAATHHRSSPAGEAGSHGSGQPGRKSRQGAAPEGAVPREDTPEFLTRGVAIGKQSSKQCSTIRQVGWLWATTGRSLPEDKRRRGISCAVVLDDGQG